MEGVAPILEAYFDDSGSEELGVVAVGGFVATQHAWSTLFQPSWKRFLSNNGLSYFRMAEYESRHGPYGGWSNDRRVSVMQEAQALINRTARLGVGVAMDVDSYHRYSPKFKNIIGWPVKPFHLCAHFAVTEVEKWRSKDSAEQVAYIFEGGSEGEGGFLRTMRTLAAAFPDGFQQDQPVSVGGKDDHVQLHAADILAYETYKAARRRLGIDQRPDRRSLLELLGADGVEYRDLLIDDRFFEWMLEKDEEMRE
jgi:hypothetical protein